MAARGLRLPLLLSCTKRMRPGAVPLSGIWGGYHTVFCSERFFACAFLPRRSLFSGAQSTAFD